MVMNFMHVDDFMRDWPRFKSWLVANGLQVLEPTNEWELARFTSPEGVAIVYRKANNYTSKWTGGAADLFEAWRKGKAFEHALKTNRTKRRDKRRAELINRIAKRDGWTCMFCGDPLTLETATIEHVVALATKGREHVANMTLACEKHNKEAGCMSVREKFEYALKLRIDGE